ncbi:MAG: COQ9 family protein [Alphaproteobacteria bacterium]|jgi:ubiquinone biosynthesis protein COQ9|nr:COQ9 family protein [Alphaproteobacteria bacterium]MCB1551480.1 COQ9 family protein [Alphaproteobacteria bacterium]MCB9985615.1 COQ9 family protein [Micavibrio sp.]HRK98344.1 COQ9 family protein [Alphaproteobacteria bacterium]
MADDIMGLRDRVLETLLSIAPTTGWHWSAVESAVKDCDMQDDAAISLFPNGLLDVMSHFSDYTDRHMIAALKDVPSSALRSKDKVRAAVLARYEFLAKHKEAVKHALAFWALPSHAIQSQRVLWRTSDRIWNWAGDTATDHSRQTKRAMLSSILIGTSMVWITDDSNNIMVTQAFLDRRLENAMEIGKTIGTMKTVIPNLFRHSRSNKN